MEAIRYLINDVDRAVVSTRSTWVSSWTNKWGKNGYPTTATFVPICSASRCKDATNAEACD
jgi:hypothetical protein